MLIFIGILAAAIISTIHIWLFCQKRTVGRCISVVLKYVFAGNVLSLAMWKMLFQYEHFLITDHYYPGDYIMYFLLCLGVCAVLLFAHALVSRQLAFEDCSCKKGKGAMALKISSVILTFLGMICLFATQWAKAEYGDLPADQIFITYFSPTTGSDMVDYTDVLEGPVLTSCLITVVFGLLVFSNLKIVYRKGDKTVTIFDDYAHRIVSIVLAAVLFISGLWYGIDKFQVLALYNAYFSHSDIIDDNYVDPRDANLKFPEKKRNLIHIYLESVENSYMSKDLGGFMDKNLIPELTQLAEEGYSFSHLDSQFGGPQVAVGTTWSVAAMVNMTTGLPMKAPTEANAYGSEGNFLPSAYTMGEILAEQGYEQTLMFGADADFGGLTYYFKSHGDFKIMDYKYAKKYSMIPSDYFVWWGYEDDKLFAFAKDELTRLSETGKPFNFIMETADTHRPDGFLSDQAQTPYPNQYANVVAYSSAEVYKFVRWIQEQPFYENTTVVITGDHLSMETNFFEFYEFDDSYQRSQYNVILNPAPGVASKDHDILFNRSYANFDMFPTILSSMGVTYDGSRLGIGTDLFSGEKTLFEEYGYQYANKELEKGSKLYNEQILAKPNQ